MRRILLALTVVTLVAVGLTARQARADFTDQLPSDMRDKVNNLMATRWPPMIKSVVLNPEAPAADAAVSVTVEAFNDSNVTEDETSEVAVLYSADEGKTWSKVDAEQQENKKLWVAEIPGQPSGTKVIYSVKATDSSGNTAITASCKMTGSPFADETYITDDCVAKKDASICEARLPRGCMFPMAIDDTPLNDDSNLVPDGFDYWDYLIGWDDENLYVDLTAEGKITAGTSSPMNIHAFLGLMINPDRPAAGSGLDSILNQGAAFVYAPLATLSGGLLKPCSYTYKKGDTAVQDDSSMVCTAKDNHLLYTVKRSAIGDNPNKVLEFLMANGNVTSISSPVSGQLYDNSRFTNVVFEEHSYTVQ
jgi:hypothetical protein